MLNQIHDKYIKGLPVGPVLVLDYGEPGLEIECCTVTVSGSTRGHK
jgi:hypothetical protein